MSREVRKQLLQAIELLEKGTCQIRELVTDCHVEECIGLLTDCQDLAIAIGTRIEKIRGEGTATVRELENYCEELYHVGEDVQREEALKEESSRSLEESMQNVKAVFEEEFPDKLEVVFLPYKASMWDSLESVWMAARDDENCEAYVIPIPYYDKNPDGTFRDFHYEGDLYPDYVPVTDYKNYDFESHRPDAIFIHNPYDEANAVTSVVPFFYSENVKKYTGCLVYIPYYATTGGVSEGQSLCRAYLNVDYIVIQHESYREFFDARIPDEKFLAMGSPKFDRIIHMCQNPPEVPDEWKKMMQGKKVYFYNTSIGGMLENTEVFLKKMTYVFKQFQNRNDACLLWRPHPLLESTFASMRTEYQAQYEAVKQKFLDEKIGIYDDTPNIETSIVLSDAYIGDDGTSVTSLFGVVGKPMFILNNAIHDFPQENDWKGVMYYTPRSDYKDQYIVTYGNQLFYSPRNDCKYEFYCNLPKYSNPGYYQRAFEKNEKIYVFPRDAENILIVQQHKVVRAIEFPHKTERGAAFHDVLIDGDYVFLLPGKYPSLIRFDLRTEEYNMIDGISSFHSGYVNGTWEVSGACINNGVLYLMSFDGKNLLKIDVSTMKFEVEDTGLSQHYVAMFPEKEGMERYWLLPYEGTVVTCLDLSIGEAKEYDLKVEGLKAFYPGRNVECAEHFFSSIAEYDGWVYFAPAYGNKFVMLNTGNGEVKEWKSPFTFENKRSGYYYLLGDHGWFIGDSSNPKHWRYFNTHERKTYDVDFLSDKVKECEILFDEQDVRTHVRGYGANSQWMRYCCNEDAFHTLQDFLDGSLCGKPFSKKEQLQEFANINASVDGDCGMKVYRFVKRHIGEKG